MESNYRSDLDGLRAVAVIPVILYHLGVGWVPGGFVGVDIFFVISGYLITGVIVREAANREFSLIRFYERRIRRIFPALFVVLICTALVGFFILDAGTFDELGRSLLATTLFSSNLYFWQQVGYFDTAAELKPLLHTWSLAVEEQFYVFFPIFLILLLRFFKSSYKYIVALVGLVSLICCIALVSHTGIDFYFAPLRAWELILGGLLVLGVFPKISNKIFANGLSLLGISSILASIFIFSTNTPYPGVAAVLPTLGAFLIIYSGNEYKTFVGNFLSWRPIVFIGLISYSLYLWHWPVVVFAKYYLIKPLSAGQEILIFLLTFLLSLISWHWVEKPFRNHTAFSQKSIFAFGLSTIVILSFLGGGISLLQGLPQRFAADLVIDEKMNRNNLEESVLAKDAKSRELTDVDFVNSLSEASFTVLGSADQKKSFAVIGDSHSGVLASGLDILAKNIKVSGLLSSSSDCPFLFGMNTNFAKKCAEYNNRLLVFLEAHPEIHTVFLAADWHVYAMRIENPDALELLLPVGQEPDGQKDILFFQQGLEQMLAKLLKLNKEVVILGDVPTVCCRVQEANSMAIRTKRDVNDIVGLSYADFQAQSATVSQIFEAIQTTYPAVKFLDISEALCTNGKCLVAQDGIPFYRDTHHLSAYGSIYVSHLFEPFLK